MSLLRIEAQGTSWIRLDTFLRENEVSLADFKETLSKEKILYLNSEPRQMGQGSMKFQNQFGYFYGDPDDVLEKANILDTDRIWIPRSWADIQLLA